MATVFAILRISAVILLICTTTLCSRFREAEKLSSLPAKVNVHGTKRKISFREISKAIPYNGPCA